MVVSSFISGMRSLDSPEFRRFGKSEHNKGLEHPMSGDIGYDADTAIP